MREPDKIEWKLGTELSEATQRACLATFVHRATVENFAARPKVAEHAYASGFRMTLLSDAEWLACSRFAVTKYGRLDARVNHCETTWPATSYPRRDIA